MAANKARRGALRLLAALAATWGTAPLARLARAQDTAPRVLQDVDYRVIPTQPVPGGNLIEVVEFFWYGCPYCYQLEPHFNAWLRRQAADIVVRRVPAAFRESWVPHARLYYTLEALGAVERLHRKVYDSYHVEQMPLNTTDAIADWAANHDIDRERWLTVYRSDDIGQRILDARDQLRRYTVSGTPSVVVDGRYLTSSGMTPGVAAMIPVLDGLVVLVREERGRRAA